MSIVFVTYSSERITESHFQNFRKSVGKMIECISLFLFHVLNFQHVSDQDGSQKIRSEQSVSHLKCTFWELNLTLSRMIKAQLLLILIYVPACKVFTIGAIE